MTKINVLILLIVVRVSSSICLTGSTGGLLRDLCECLCVPSDKTERIQESHIMIGHILCKMVEERCFPKEAQDFNKS